MHDRLKVVGPVVDAIGHDVKVDAPLTAAEHRVGWIEGHVRVAVSALLLMVDSQRVHHLMHDGRLAAAGCDLDYLVGTRVDLPHETRAGVRRRLEEDPVLSVLDGPPVVHQEEACVRALVDLCERLLKDGLAGLDIVVEGGVDTGAGPAVGVTGDEPPFDDGR